MWRRDDTVVEKSGLSFGGLVLPGKIDFARAFRSAAVALAWALGFAAFTFAPFYFGWHWWWHPAMKFAIDVKPLSLANDAAGQLLMIALPEESFYRGYLQSRLDEVFVSRNTVKTHAIALYRKLGVGTRSAAVERARSAGLLDP